MRRHALCAHAKVLNHRCCCFFFGSCCRHAGWPGVVYCEEDAVHRLMPSNIIMQPSDARTGKYAQFQLDRDVITPAAAGGIAAFLPTLPRIQPTF